MSFQDFVSSGVEFIQPTDSCRSRANLTHPERREAGSFTQLRPLAMCNLRARSTSKRTRRLTNLLHKYYALEEFESSVNGSKMIHISLVSNGSFPNSHQRGSKWEVFLMNISFHSRNNYTMAYISHLDSLLLLNAEDVSI